MPQIQFHETRAGAEFYRRTMPELVTQLTRIADALERIAGESAEASPSSTVPPGSAEGSKASDAKEQR